jgi:predicted Na+-dependent transporter
MVVSGSVQAGGVPSRALGRLARQWFLMGLFAAALLGCLFPAAGEALRAGIPYLVAAVMFLSGFTMGPRNLVRQARDPRGILIAFSSVYLAAPLLGMLLARLFAPARSGPEFLEAVMVLASQAATISSAIALTLVAGGNGELALINTLVTNLSTVVMTPLAIKLTIGAEIRFEFSAMAQSLAATVLAPVVGGLFARACLQGLAGYRPGARTLRGARTVSQCFILIFVVVGFGRAAPRLSEEPALAARFLALALVLHAALLALTWMLSRAALLDPRSRAAVIFTGSQKTLPNGIYTAEKFFPSNPYAALPMVIYHVLQLIVDTALVPLLASRIAEGNRAGEHPRTQGECRRVSTP